MSKSKFNGVHPECVWNENGILLLDFSCWRTSFNIKTLVRNKE
jgi:hypothetical protein